MIDVSWNWVFGLFVFFGYFVYILNNVSKIIFYFNILFILCFVFFIYIIIYSLFGVDIFLNCFVFFLVDGFLFLLFGIVLYNEFLIILFWMFKFDLL